MYLQIVASALKELNILHSHRIELVKHQPEEFQHLDLFLKTFFLCGYTHICPKQ